MLQETPPEVLEVRALSELSPSSKDSAVGVGSPLPVRQRQHPAALAAAGREQAQTAPVALPSEAPLGAPQHPRTSAALRQQRLALAIPVGSAAAPVVEIRPVLEPEPLAGEATTAAPPAAPVVMVEAPPIMEELEEHSTATHREVVVAPESHPRVWAGMVAPD